MHNFFKLKKWTSLFLVLLMVVSLCMVGMPTTVLAEADTIDLQILATSDLHGRFMTWDYATDTEYTKGSLVQIATLVKEMRNENPNTIVVDNGDTIQGNSNQIFLNEDTHPMILAMNEIGYDTFTLGNHEFNYGIPTLEKIISKLNAKVLAGNVYKPDGNKLVAPYQIVERAGIKIGIIGMTNPNIVMWDKANLEGYSVTSPIDETKNAITELKDNVDVMIGVIHVGPEEEYGNDDGADVIAQECPELVAIVAGHAHSKIEGNRVNNVLITEPYKNGDMVSKINIKLTKNAQGKYVIENRETDVNSSLISVKDYMADEDLSAELLPYHQRALEDARTVIGKLEGGDLVPADEVKGIPTSQIQDTAMIDLINDVQLYYTGADVAAAAAFSTSANIKEGGITKAGVAQIYKYDNTLYKLKVTGKQLKMYMEWSATYYNTYHDGDLTVSFNPEIRGYNYDMFSGVKYQVDISKESGSRIVNLTRMNGEAIKDTDFLTLAVNNYRANSQLLVPGKIYQADNLPQLIEKDVKGDIGGVRELIVDYIVNVKGGTIISNYDGNWQIVGNTWSPKHREIAVRMINEEKIFIPWSEDGRTPNVRSITWEEILKTADRTIDILSFNDFHGAMKEEGSKNIGAAKLAGEIKKAREANPDTIIVSAGDMYQGSAMSNLTYGEPVSEFLKAIKLEASAVGNHEFDWGLGYINQWAADGGFEFLASNIYEKVTKKPVDWVEPYKIVEVGGVRIGLIGLSTLETAYKTKPENVEGIEFRDPIESANYWAKYLKTGKKENRVDYVIALTHLGASQDYETNEITGEAADLAKDAKRIDGIIAGHTHKTVSGYVNNIPIVEAYYNGRSIAKLSIEFNVQGKLLGIKPSVDSLYKRRDELVEDPEVKAIYDMWEAELAPILNEVLGTTDKELTHDKSLGVSLLGEWVCDVMKETAETQIAITNGGGLRTSIPEGEITMGKMYEVMPFDNTLVKMQLKGSDIKRVIENGIDNKNIGWVQISGIKVYYDSAAESGDRITSMRLLDGTRIEMDNYYSVVTNDFMFTGGDGYDFSGAKDPFDTGVPIRDALVNEIKAVQNLSVEYVDYMIDGVDPLIVLNNDRLQRAA